MQKLFDDINFLDSRCYDQFKLSEELLMEHAAYALYRFISNKFSEGSSVLVVCGSGHNGADGIALTRLLQNDFSVKLYIDSPPKSDLAKLQLERAYAVNVTKTDEIKDADIIVDALFGSGLNRELKKRHLQLIKQLNSLNGQKIACDIPSGLLQDGTLSSTVFDADTTITMGALKKSLYSDIAKDVTGKILVANLGVSRTIYETNSNWNLLDLDDLKLPYRVTKSSHKGTYGHLALLCGEKEGASIIAAKAALNFGAGLVTMITHENPQIPYEIMKSTTLPKNCNAVCAGMGLGNSFDSIDLKNMLIGSKMVLLIDADLFYNPIITQLIKKKNIVITPHPKEFVSLLKYLNIADVDVEELQNSRFKYSEEFSKRYPDVVLLLKGANPIIAYKNRFYINPHGTNKLSKGGSGDVLSGIIGALLAQGYSTLDAAINGSLAHVSAAKKVTKNNYALTPSDLIEEVACL